VDAHRSGEPDPEERATRHGEGGRFGASTAGESDFFLKKRPFSDFPVADEKAGGL
jgi:hypothetical protein